MRAVSYFAGLACGLALLTQTCLALPATIEIPSLEEAARAIKRQAKTFAITGVPGPTHPRLEVRQMLFDQGDQWTLLILGLQAFHAYNQSDLLSYYQIAGIHGVPRQNWDGVGQCASCSDADGYCPHDSVLFPGWHRAYVALFEQQFMTVVNQIALTFPASQRAKMVAAASTMRWPYWDWAAQPKPGRPTFPVVVSQKYVTINGPTGSQTIINPLFRHDFQDPSSLYYSPFTNWHVTLRYPVSNDVAAYSVEANVTSAFENIRPSLQDQMYQMFSTCTDFLHFSNDDAGSSSTSCSNSLEGIHNTVHTVAGGPGSASVSAGHMTYLATAAFDPLFWLHHCNVDRYFALWQGLNPTVYGGSQIAPHNTWTITAGSTQDENSPLAPFHKDTSGTFWTSKQVQNWSSTFHYTYPEFSNSDGSTGAIASFINKLYGPSATATAGSSKRTAGPEPVAAPAAEPTLEADYQAQIEGRQLPKPIHAPELLPLPNPLTARNGSQFQYVANIKAPRYSLNGSYYIYLFNGKPVSEAPGTWLLDANLIGPMGVLAQTNMTMSDLTAAGSVPLTRTLTAAVNAGHLIDLRQATVIPYLKQQLQWRVAQNGTAIDPSTITNFEIAVFASTATPPTQFSLPSYSAFVPLVAITENKSGGANTTANAVAT